MEAKHQEIKAEAILSGYTKSLFGTDAVKSAEKRQRWEDRQRVVLNLFVEAVFLGIVAAIVLGLIWLAGVTL